MKIERVVLDSNVLISAALNARGIPRAVIQDVRTRNGILLFSLSTFDELSTRLLRPKFDRYISRDRRKEYISNIEALATWVSITKMPLGCRDPDDDKVLETALRGAADCIVTGDKDLLDMSPFRGISILTPREYLQIFAL